MPTIHVEFFEGRTPQQKAALAKELTDACAEHLPLVVALVLGGSPEAVDVIFRDVARHDWATGGVLWSEKGAQAGGSSSSGSSTQT